MHPKLKRFIATAGDLPSMPAVAAKIMEMAEDPNVSVDDLRRVIERDPALAARILKVVNSSLYGFSRKIETLGHAITLLGLRTVRNLVLAASLKHSFKNFGLTEKLLWEHAVLAGPVAARFAEHPSIAADREEAFTAGLLHDLGKVALNNAARDQYNKVISRVYNEGISFVEAERDAFGFDHAELGGHVAAKWQLSERLETVIRHHHDGAILAQLPEEDARLTALTTLTTAFCTRLGVGRRGPVEALDPTRLPAWSFLGLAPEELDTLLAWAGEEVKKAEEIVR